jgi:hypothetical protein
MTDQRVLKNIKTGEEIIVEWDNATLYEKMDDNMIVKHLKEKWEVVFKDRSYFDFNRNSNKAGVPMIQSWSRPLKSDGAGCHPTQAKEFNEQAKKDGFSGVRFSEDGTCHFSTRGQRKKYLRKIGMLDRNAGYGD